MGCLSQPMKVGCASYTEGKKKSTIGLMRCICWKKPPNPEETEEENRKIVVNQLEKNLPTQMRSWGGKPKDRGCVWASSPEENAEKEHW